jgi:hypothetical protein
MQDSNFPTIMQIYENHVDVVAIKMHCTDMRRFRITRKSGAKRAPLLLSNAPPVKMGRGRTAYQGDAPRPLPSRASRYANLASLHRKASLKAARNGQAKTRARGLPPAAAVQTG